MADETQAAGSGGSEEKPREQERKTVVVDGEELELVDLESLPAFDPGGRIDELTEEDMLLRRYGLTDDIEIYGVKLKAP